MYKFSQKHKIDIVQLSLTTINLQLHKTKKEYKHAKENSYTLRQQFLTAQAEMYAKINQQPKEAIIKQLQQKEKNQNALQKNKNTTPEIHPHSPLQTASKFLKQFPHTRKKR